jgi:hypothetical protein
MCALWKHELGEAEPKEDTRYDLFVKRSEAKQNEKVVNSTAAKRAIHPKQSWGPHIMEPERTQTGLKAVTVEVDRGMQLLKKIDPSHTAAIDRFRGDLIVLYLNASSEGGRSVAASGRTELLIDSILELTHNLKQNNLNPFIFRQRLKEAFEALQGSSQNCRGPKFCTICNLCKGGTLCGENTPVIQFELSGMIDLTTGEPSQRGMGSLAIKILYAAALSYNLGGRFGGVAVNGNGNDVLRQEAHNADRSIGLDFLFGRASHAVRQRGSQFSKVIDVANLYKGLGMSLKPAGLMNKKFHNLTKATNEVFAFWSSFKALRQVVHHPPPEMQMAWLPSPIWYMDFGTSSLGRGSGKVRIPYFATNAVFNDDFLRAIRRGNECSRKAMLASNGCFKKRTKSSPRIIRIVAHIRRGDIVHVHESRAKHKYAGRVAGDAYYQNVFDTVRRAINLRHPNADVEMYGFTSCADDNVTKCNGMKSELQTLYGNDNISLKVDWEGSPNASKDLLVAWAHMMSADVLVMSMSKMSYIGAIYNDKCILQMERDLYPPLKRWLSMNTAHFEGEAFLNHGSDETQRVAMYLDKCLPAIASSEFS